MARFHIDEPTAKGKSVIADTDNLKTDGDSESPHRHVEADRPVVDLANAAGKFVVIQRKAATTPLLGDE